MFNLQFKNWLNCVSGRCRKPTYEQLLATVAELVKKTEELDTNLASIGTATFTGDTVVLGQDPEGNIGPLSSSDFDSKVLDTLNSNPLPGSLLTINFIGDGGANSVAIPHGLSSIPSFYLVTPANSDSSDVSYVEATLTDIIVHFNAATTVGTGNIQLMVAYKE